MKIIVIDNYDSFTYNLVHYLEDLDCEVTVKRNDNINLKYVEKFDKILISPGPGIPDEAGMTKKIIEEFKFETPKNLPKICSLISGYFSYDSIRYVEKIPNNCKNDLNLPDVRLLRPRTLVIHDNLKKEIFYIIRILFNKSLFKINFNFVVFL